MGILTRCFNVLMLGCFLGDNDGDVGEFWFSEWVGLGLGV
jgi:hypothetical protein